MDIHLTWNVVPVVAVLVSLLAWYVPKFKDWYDKLEPAKKQLFMVGLMALTVVVGVLLSIFNFYQIYQASTWQAWVWYPLVDFVFALLINAGAYRATDKIFKGTAAAKG